MRKVDMKSFLETPDRYQLRSGHEAGAPTCPYGNHYQWVGFDTQLKEYVRFTKSVFKVLVQKIEQEKGFPKA